MSNELYRLTATEAARQIEDGTLKPADLMDACLERIAAREPAIHAFAYHDPDAARAALPGPAGCKGFWSA
jgi:Asp-tRNA(Asn)/Glu-tRNA(Gln) amidotransferase A subunit family amidase